MEEVSIKQINDESYSAAIRLILVHNPSTPVTKIMDHLERNGMKLSFKTVAKYVQEIKQERIERYFNAEIGEEIARFEDLSHALSQQLWAIVTDKGASNFERVAAVKAIVDTQKTLLDKKFDAGVFERKIGTLQINHELNEEETDMIRKAIEYARPRKIDRIIDKKSTE